jgi:hypothetical protein
MNTFKVPTFVSITACTLVILVDQLTSAITLSGPFQVSTPSVTSKWSLNNSTGTITTNLKPISLLPIPTSTNNSFNLLNNTYQNPLTQNWSFAPSTQNLNGEFVALATTPVH